MKISVEISTYNRKGMLKDVLKSLCCQTFPADKFEVIVSSDGSTDGTDTMLRELAPSLPYTLVYVSHDHKGPGATHNLGINKAKGDLVLMLADDILADPELLEAHVTIHDAHPDLSVVVSGKLKQSDKLQNTQFQSIWNGLVTKLFSGGIDSIRHEMFLVSNLSFKKQFFVESGMFQEWPPASHEDLELGYRMRRNGMKLIHNPKALGYHHHDENIKSVCNRAYLQGQHWHYFENHVPQLWIRQRSGHIFMSDGIKMYFVFLIKKCIRKVLINKWFVDRIAIPVINLAEKLPVLSFCVPFLIKRVAGFYFYKGISDYKNS